MPGDLPRKPSGSDAEAKYAQSLYQRVYNESRVGNVTGHRVINSTNGKLIVPSRAPGGGGSADVTQFKLRFVEDDYLVCREWDGTTLGSDDIYVLKPYKLRCSLASAQVYGETHNYTYAPDASEPDMAFGDGGTWSGETEAQYDPGGLLASLKLNTVRSVEADGLTEDQRVIPVWLKGDIIYGLEFDGGNTTTGFITDADKPIEYLMIGESRQWGRI